MNLTSFFIDKCFEYLLKEDKVTSEQCEEGTEKQISPPWSSDPEIFNTLCTGCGACATACTKDLIILEEGGLPVMDFTKGFCHFCGD